jgi:PTH1 family peptidyl-tRNA hydrolase
MHLIIGLGNPGVKYLMTRHNVGFMAIDNFILGSGNPPSKNEHQAIFYKFKLDGVDVGFVKPQTFMNLSGESVGALVRYYNVALENLLVIHDEIDGPFGSTRFQKNRGPGGHNGIKSIHEHLSTEDYCRLRLGVGRPENPQMDVAVYVLQNFSEAEQKLMPEWLNYVSDAIESFIFNGFEKTATQFNRKSLPQLG